LRLEVEVAGQDDVAVVDEMVKRMHERFSVTPLVKALTPGSLPRTAHKAKLIHIEQPVR
jgi:hypothetical protein